MSLTDQNILRAAIQAIVRSKNFLYQLKYLHHDMSLVEFDLNESV